MGMIIPWVQTRSLASNPGCTLNSPESESVSLSVVSYSFRPIDCSPSGSSACGILQTRILERVAIPFSRGSSQPRDWIPVSCIAGRPSQAPLAVILILLVCGGTGRDDWRFFENLSGNSNLYQGWELLILVSWSHFPDEAWSGERLAQVIQPDHKDPGLSYPGCQPPRLVLMKEICSLGALQVKVEVAQFCPTLCSRIDYTVHGILQARILEWVAFPFSRGSSQPRSPALQACSLPAEPLRKPFRCCPNFQSLSWECYIDPSINLPATVIFFPLLVPIRLSPAQRVLQTRSCSSRKYDPLIIALKNTWNNPVHSFVHSFKNLSPLGAGTVSVLFLLYRA